MKKILLIATGGTIASKYTADGLAPQISAEELLEYIPEAKEFCTIDTVQPFALDSTNVCADHWLKLARLIESKYEFYDGFVLCHGTDTMAYTAAALSYLIQNNRRPIVITGAQKPIDLAITDARSNLMDSLRFASHDRAHGISIVFGGKVIAGTRAKKNFPKAIMLFPALIIRILRPSMIRKLFSTLMTRTSLPNHWCFTMRDEPEDFSSEADTWN